MNMSKVPSTLIARETKLIAILKGLSELEKMGLKEAGQCFADTKKSDNIIEGLDWIVEQRLPMIMELKEIALEQLKWPFRVKVKHSEDEPTWTVEWIFDIDIRKEAAAELLEKFGEDISEEHTVHEGQHFRRFSLHRDEHDRVVATLHGGIDC